MLIYDNFIIYQHNGLRSEHAELTREGSVETDKIVNLVVTLKRGS